MRAQQRDSRAHRRVAAEKGARAPLLSKAQGRAVALWSEGTLDTSNAHNLGGQRGEVQPPQPLTQRWLSRRYVLAVLYLKDDFFRSGSIGEHRAELSSCEVHQADLSQRVRVLLWHQDHFLIYLLKDALSHLQSPLVSLSQIMRPVARPRPVSIIFQCKSETCTHITAKEKFLMKILTNGKHNHYYKNTKKISLSSISLSSIS